MKQSKYGAIKTVVDGITFDSKKEAQHYSGLKLLEMAGKISDLQLQVPFRFRINGDLMFTYKADFVYVENGMTKIVDVKGFKTSIYKLKKKIIEAQYGIEITEA